MLQIHCSGSPHEIGFKHGTEAREAITRTIAFYTWMFQDSAKMEWPKVRELAMELEPVMREKWPAYLEEMNGIAEGANLPLADVIAINVRTEIAFGLFSDGCTALSWLTPSTSWLAQNWDWNPRQQENIIFLTIAQPDKPTIKMLTEAGLIGKIGLNSAGVGVCLNAIRAKGMDPTRLPCHMGLRMVLDSNSRDEAVQKLEKYGVASACHMLVADSTGGISLEWSSTEHRKIPTNGNGQVFHSNHYLVPHEGVIDTVWLKDSPVRVRRIEELCKGIEADGEPTYEKLLEMFKDETNAPGSICRSVGSESTSATLFNIVMELDVPRARVVMGRTSEKGEKLELVF